MFTNHLLDSALVCGQFTHRGAVFHITPRHSYGLPELTVGDCLPALMRKLDLYLSPFSPQRMLVKMRNLESRKQEVERTPEDVCSVLPTHSKSSGFSFRGLNCGVLCTGLFPVALEEEARLTRKGHEVGLGLCHCRVLGEFISRSSKHLCVPAGRSGDRAQDKASRSVSPYLYVMFPSRISQAVCSLY